MPTVSMGMMTGALSPNNESGAQTSAKIAPVAQRPLTGPIGMLIMMISILSGALTSVQTAPVALCPSSGPSPTYEAELPKQISGAQSPISNNKETPEIEGENCQMKPVDAPLDGGISPSDAMTRKIGTLSAVLIYEAEFPKRIFSAVGNDGREATFALTSADRCATVLNRDINKSGALTSAEMNEAKLLMQIFSAVDTCGIKATRTLTSADGCATVLNSRERRQSSLISADKTR